MAGKLILDSHLGRFTKPCTHYLQYLVRTSSGHEPHFPDTSMFSFTPFWSAPDSNVAYGVLPTSACFVLCVVQIFGSSANVHMEHNITDGAVKTSYAGYGTHDIKAAVVSDSRVVGESLCIKVQL